MKFVFGNYNLTCVILCCAAIFSSCNESRDNPHRNDPISKITSPENNRKPAVALEGENEIEAPSVFPKEFGRGSEFKIKPIERTVSEILLIVPDEWLKSLPEDLQLKARSGDFVWMNSSGFLTLGIVQNDGRFYTWEDAPRYDDLDSRIFWFPRVGEMPRSTFPIKKDSEGNIIVSDKVVVE